jgi:hypothetical protein
VAIPRSGEQFAEVGGGIELCYQTIGEPERPPVVLMMGIGSQMLAWPDGFCDLLAARGAFVIRLPKIHGYDVLPKQDLTECCSMDFVAPRAGSTQPHVS